MTAPPIRAAEAADIDQLLSLEEAAFPGDRLDRRNFRHAIRSPSILTLVAGERGTVAGYVFVETRRGSRSGRISSIAVAPGWAGRGLGRRLLAAAEDAARAAGCQRLRLEVRADNRRAARLYEAARYERRETLADYYEDGQSAQGYEKRLVAPD